MTARQPLPKLFRQERHERGQQPECTIERSVEHPTRCDLSRLVATVDDRFAPLEVCVANVIFDKLLDGLCDLEEVIVLEPLVNISSRRG